MSCPAISERFVLFFLLFFIYHNDLLFLYNGFRFRWVVIGFQGSDPSTDLRDMGMMGPLRISYITVFTPQDITPILFSFFFSL